MGRSNTANANATTTPKPPRRAARKKLTPKKDQVLIRMYGQGLGDCFLLAIPRSPAAADDRPVYVLIDCGVMVGTPDGAERMRTIVHDIKETTGGRLDLLVITHEHLDHLSGFLAAEEEWGQIEVGELWMAWTELDVRSGLPDVLRKFRERQRQALEQVATRALRFGLGDRHATLLGLLAFDTDVASGGSPFGFSQRVENAYKNAKGLVKDDAKRVCCEPGEVRRLPGTEARAYVLGPPRNEQRLRQLDSTTKQPETFEDEAKTNGDHGVGDGDAAAGRPVGADLAGLVDLAPAFGLQRIVEGRSGFNAFAMPLLGPMLAVADEFDPGDALDPEAATQVQAERNLYERSFPFDHSLGIPLLDAEAAAANRAAEFPALASYANEDNHWRRIDFDWLASAEGFALQADELTNNISLVLAFELPPEKADAERKVLLFVGDAQVGNWLSWDEIGTWQPREDVGPLSPTADIGDLLKRTVFYKVGHHGSHNATLKAKGVERMLRGRALTAFVPVSLPVAREVRGWTRMPLDSLMDALSERTGNRLVLPNGVDWSLVKQATPPTDAEIDAARERIGLTVSPATLPAKVRETDGVELEAEVPLWVQIAVDY